MFIKKVVSAFNTHRVPYALVGGHAVSLHGAIRGTLDLDFVIEHSEAAFQNAEQALQSIDLHPRLPVTATEVFLFRDEYIKNRDLLDWSFANRATPSELVDIVLTVDFRKIKTVKVQIEQSEIIVISKKDLIKMKSKTNRPQDKEDIKALKKL